MNSFKVILKIGFTAVLAFLLQTIFPWWSIVIASFLIGFIISTGGTSSFIAGFLGIGILWFFMAALTDIKTDSILTSRVAEIFSLPNSWSLILATACIGGVVGGFGALTGSYLRSWIMPTNMD
ncbi:MAG: hypothetical protein MI975_29430 [Cytophagales bacterium]|nr:hypothetical protein [Cytophagales bacterium]